MAWKDIGYKLKASFIGAAAVVVLSAVALYFVSSTGEEIALSGLIAVTAAVLGWGVRIILSPYSSGEKTRFNKIVKTIAAFASGYLVGKIDKLITHVFDPNVILDPVVGTRVLLGLSSFVLLVILVYVFRQYAD